MPQTLQADSKTKKLVNLGRAIFKRTSDPNTISARSQRFFRASKAKGIWSNGVKRARIRWGKAMKSKKARRESKFDSMYPVGRIPSHDSEYLPEPPQVFRAAGNSSSVQSPFSVQYVGHRHSQAPSVTVTNPTPSNSRRNLGYRQSQYTIHNPDAAYPGTPSTARTVSREIDPIVDSDDQFIEPIPNIHTAIPSKYSSTASTPHDGQFDGQVNASTMYTEQQLDARDARQSGSDDFLDGFVRSDRDRLPSQHELGRNAARPFSVPTQTDPRLTPASTEPRPLTTQFEAPQLPAFALPPNLERLRQSICEITGAPESTGPQGAMAALVGDDAPTAKASAISDAEIYHLMAHGQTSKYPGQPRPYSYFQPLQPGKEQTARPVQAAGNGHSRPSTPFTPPRLPKGKQAEDPEVQKHLDELRKKKIDKKHKTLSRMLDRAILDDPPSTSSGLDDNDPNWTTFPDPDQNSYAPKHQRPQTPEMDCRPLRIEHKPVARRPSARNPNTDKSLPMLPPEALLAKPRHHHKDVPARPYHPPATSRISTLERRIADLESRPVNRSPAAAGARAAANLHSKGTTGGASNLIPRGPHHRAKPPTDKKAKHDMHRRRDERDEHQHQPSAASVWRDVVTITRNAVRKNRK